MLDTPLSGLPWLKNEASLEAFHWLGDSYVAPYSPAAFSALLVSPWPSPDLGGVEISFFITAVLVTRVWNCKGSICQDGILAYLTITWLRRCKSQLFYNSRTGHLDLKMYRNECLSRGQCLSYSGPSLPWVRSQNEFLHSQTIPWASSHPGPTQLWHGWLLADKFYFSNTGPQNSIWILNGYPFLWNISIWA